MMTEETRHWNPLEYENHSCPDCTQKDTRIAALEAEAKMLRFSLAAHPDKLTSTGAAQAAMTYEIELRDRRIAELETQQATFEYNASQIITSRDNRIAELEVELAETKEELLSLLESEGLIHEREQT